MSTPGATELLIVLVIVLLIMGPKRLPSLGRQLGGGIREFRRSIGGGDGGTAGRTSEDGHRDDAPAEPASPPASRVHDAGSAPAPTSSPRASTTGEGATGEPDSERRSV